MCAQAILLKINKYNHQFYPNKTNTHIERHEILYLTWVTTSFKSTYEISLFYDYCILQDLKLSLLVSKINETESAMAEIETAASKQLQGLALQSEQALEGAQKKLQIASEKVEEFTLFVKVWIICALLTCTFLLTEWAVACLR